MVYQEQQEKIGEMTPKNEVFFIKIGVKRAD
jgi:hypothetical protein